MINLLKIELRKIVPNKTFWILVGLYVLLTSLILFGIQGFMNQFSSEMTKDTPVEIPSFSLYRFPSIWHNLTNIVGFLKIFLGVVVIILITNEYSFKTVRQNVIAGLSRTDFMAGKVILTFMLSVGAALLVFIIGLILGFINTPSISFSKVFNNTNFLFAYFLEIFTFLLFSLLIGFLFKRSGLSIGFLLLYSYIVEPILVYKLPSSFERFLPLESASRLIGLPKTSIMKLLDKFDFKDYVAIEDALVSVGFCVLFTYLIYLIIRKRDL